LNHGIESPGDLTEVRGFAVESLLKFRDFRAAQGGEASALHCIVAHLYPHHPDLLIVLRQELRAVLEPSDGAEVCILDGGISDLHDAASRFQSEIDLVQGEMDRFAEIYRAEGEGIVEVLERLLEDGREMATGLNEELRTTLTTARRLLEYFGERHQAELPMLPNAVEKFFCTIREFVGSFEECWRDVVENPRKLRLEGMVVPPPPKERSASPSIVAPNSKEARETSPDADPAPVRPAFIMKQSPKATAAAAWAAAAASAVNERRAKNAITSDAPTEGQCATNAPWRANAPLMRHQFATDAPTEGQCAMYAAEPVRLNPLAAEAANVAAMRRRKTTGMLRLGGPDFGAARLLPPPASAGD